MSDEEVFDPAWGPKNLKSMGEGEERVKIERRRRRYIYVIITSYYWKERVGMLETMGRQSRKNNYKSIVVVGGNMRGSDIRQELEIGVEGGR